MVIVPQWLPLLLWALNLPTLQPAGAHSLFYSVFQGPNPPRVLLFLLFPLTLEAYITVAQNKHMREMNWPFIPPRSALERNAEKIVSEILWEF